MLTLLCFCVEDEVATASVSTYNSARSFEAADFTGQVLPPPAVDFTAQALASSSTTSSPATSTQSATVKREWDFTGQVLPHEQASLVGKTESLSVGSHSRARNLSDEADVTRRTAELVACLSFYCGRYAPWCYFPYVCTSPYATPVFPECQITQ